MKIEKCPFCGGEAIVVKTESCGRYIGCWDCGGRTEEFETDYAGSAHDKAIAAWNRRAEPENNPLTIDELKQMDGEPVWISGINRWGVVSGKIVDVNPDKTEYRLTIGFSYGWEWLDDTIRGRSAYRCKPKEEV